MFKPGDKVRRVSHHNRNKLFTDKEKVFTVLAVTKTEHIYLAEEPASCWVGAYFELVTEKRREKKWIVGKYAFDTFERAKQWSSSESLILEVEIVAHHIPTTNVIWEKKEL